MDGSFAYRLLADAVVIIHLGFIVFVMVGGFLALLFPKVIWVHLPCVAWGITVELAGFVCPLTPLENLYRYRAGQDRYAGDFVMHYIEPLIYPEGLTRETQAALAVIVILVNTCAYGWLALRKYRSR